MNVQLIASVAAGGAIGAVGRYLVMGQIGRWFHAPFPWATLTVNILGSFILGALIEAMALAWSPSAEVRAMVIVGMLGAFTTFSTFSLDVFYLIERGQLPSAGLYVASSVVLSIGACFAGLMLFRHILG